MIRSFTTAIVSMLFSFALAAPALARGDFPFFCRSAEFDMHDFAIQPTDSSPTGYVASLHTRLGRSRTIPVQVEQDENGALRVEGVLRTNVLFDMHFLALIPPDCDEECDSFADLKTTPAGVPFNFATIPTPASCSTSAPTE